MPHVRKQLLTTLVAIGTMVVFLIAGIWLWHPDQSGSTVARQPQGPLAKISQWLEPPPPATLLFLGTRWKVKKAQTLSAAIIQAEELQYDQKWRRILARGAIQGIELPPQKTVPSTITDDKTSGN